MLGSNFALLVKSPGDDGQQLLTTGSRSGMYIVESMLHTFEHVQGVWPGWSQGVPVWWVGAGSLYGLGAWRGPV